MMDIVCFLSDSLGETDYYYSRMDEVEEERWIYKTRKGVKNNALPSFPPPKGPLCFCRFLSKNEKKCRQKSVEEFVNETRTKKHAHQIGDGDDDERTKERGSSSRAWSSRLFFFSFAFFSERAR